MGTLPAFTSQHHHLHWVEIYKASIFICWTPYHTSHRSSTFFLYIKLSAAASLKARIMHEALFEFWRLSKLCLILLSSGVTSYQVGDFFPVWGLWQQLAKWRRRRGEKNEWRMQTFFTVFCMTSSSISKYKKYFPFCQRAWRIKPTAKSVSCQIIGISPILWFNRFKTSSFCCHFPCRYILSISWLFFANLWRQWQFLNRI